MADDEHTPLHENEDDRKKSEEEEKKKREKEQKVIQNQPLASDNNLPNTNAGTNSTNTADGDTPFDDPDCCVCMSWDCPAIYDRHDGGDFVDHGTSNGDGCDCNCGHGDCENCDCGDCDCGGCDCGGCDCGGCDCGDCCIL